MIIKKYLNLMLMLLFLALSFNSYGASNNTSTVQSAIDSQSCGVTNAGVVKPDSGSICPEDISYRIFYKLFPDVFDKIVLKIIDPGYLTQVQSDEENNIEVYRGYQYALIYAFKTIINLSFFVLGFFVSYYAFIGLLKSMESGEFLGSDWDVSGMFKKYGFITVMLIPVGNGMVVGQIVIFILIIAGIFLANYLWGAYLSYLQVGSNPLNVSQLQNSTQNQTETHFNFINGLVKNGDHIKYNSDYFTQKLVDISLCKKRNEQYLTDVNSSFILSGSINNFEKCIVKNPNVAEIKDSKLTGNNLVNHDAFFTYNTQSTGLITPDNFSSTDTLFRTSSIDLGSHDQNNNYCQNYNFNSEYNCGKVIANVPDIKDPKIKTIFNEINFYDKYDTVSSQIINTADSNSVYTEVNQGWENIYSSLLAYYNKNSAQGLTPQEENKIKVISYIYHQLIYNDILAGNVSLKENAQSNIALNKSLPSPIIAKYLLSSNVADNILNYACTENQDLLKKSKKMLSEINGNSALKGDISATCLKINSNGNFSLYGTDLTGSSSPIKDAQIAELKYKKDAQDSFNAVANTYYKELAGVEYSLYKSMTPFSSNILVKKIRKEGWFDLGSYSFKVSKEEEFQNKLKLALENSVSFQSNSSLLGNFISVNNKQAGESASVSNNYIDISSYRNDIIPQMDKNFSPNVNAGAFLTNYISDKMINNNTTFSPTDLSSIMSLLKDPFASFKTAIGYSRNQSLDIASMTKCLSNSNIQCPIPMENPLIGISNFGNQLINVSTTAMAVSIMASSLMKKISNKEYFKNGELKDAVNSSKKMSKRDVLFGAFSHFVDFMSFVMSIIASFSGMLLLLGIMFSYVIPLIPFVAFTMAFIAWVVFSLQALFLFPLWCVFSLRMVSRGNANSEVYRGAYNIFMQITFKPIVTVAVYLLMWTLLSILVAVLNFTIVSFMVSSMDIKSMFLQDFATSIILLLTYAILLYVIVNMVFKNLHTMVQSIFGYMKVEHAKDAPVKAEDLLNNAITGGVLANYLFQGGVSSRISDYHNNIKREKENNFEEKTKEKREERFNNVVGESENEISLFEREQEQENNKNSENKNDNENT